VGVTTNLVRRIYEHREGFVDGFTKRYGLKTLVYYEQYDDVPTAIQREKTVKHWPRPWKVRLIHGLNPTWEDLIWLSHLKGVDGRDKPGHDEAGPDIDSPSKSATATGFDTGFGGEGRKGHPDKLKRRRPAHPGRPCSLWRIGRIIRDLFIRPTPNCVSNTAGWDGSETSCRRRC